MSSKSNLLYRCYVSFVGYVIKWHVPYFRLIGTDALARGIDIPDCNYVVSYDPPRNIKTYIHRVGRTGRAGRLGHAVTILLQNQVNQFKVIVV